MAIYKEMYHKLFNYISKTIEELQIVQQECEEIYMSNEPKPSIKLADKAKQETDKERLDQVLADNTDT